MVLFVPHFISVLLTSLFLLHPPPLNGRFEGLSSSRRKFLLNFLLSNASQVLYILKSRASTSNPFNLLRVRIFKMLRINLARRLPPTPPGYYSQRALLSALKLLESRNLLPRGKLNLNCILPHNPTNPCVQVYFSPSISSCKFSSSKDAKELEGESSSKIN